MGITGWLTTYAAMTVAFFVIDMLWLGVIARPLYQSQLGHLLGDVNWIAAVVFYLVFLVGICIFAVAPAVVTQQLTTALVYGALFGFFTYATYDMTNLATLKDWPLMIVFIDIAWGTILSASVAAVGYLTATSFFA
jgi:uncharacterized membrane protein